MVSAVKLFIYYNCRSRQRILHYVKQLRQRSNKWHAIVYSFFKFVKIAFLSQLMAASAIHRQYLRALSYVAKEEAKAEINCPLSSSRENDVATAPTAPFYFPPSRIFIPAHACEMAQAVIKARRGI